MLVWNWVAEATVVSEIAADLVGCLSKPTCLSATAHESESEAEYDITFGHVLLRYRSGFAGRPACQESSNRWHSAQSR